MQKPKLHWFWLAVGITVMGLAASLENGVAADSAKQDKGIVNERSTGNEPFMGTGASGGPMHSTPDATERSVQDRSSSNGQINTGADLTGGRARLAPALTALAASSEDAFRERIKAMNERLLRAMENAKEDKGRPSH